MLVVLSLLISINKTRHLSLRSFNLTYKGLQRELKHGKATIRREFFGGIRLDIGKKNYRSSHIYIIFLKKCQCLGIVTHAVVRASELCLGKSRKISCFSFINSTFALIL